ncbi:MAG: hypothetical protein AAF564_20290 [Bacteroidota bacterium]
MNQNSENEGAKRSPLSYELIVRNNKTSRESGAPHLILRKQRKATDELKVEAADLAKESAPETEEAPAEAKDVIEKMVTAERVSDYISSLNDHVPDDIARVVDAIIEEEGKMPTNLPKLDDQLSAIFPGSDVKDYSGDDLFFEKESEEESTPKPAKYTNRVEYEDL